MYIDENGTMIPERSAATAMKRAAGMAIDDGQLALAEGLFGIDEAGVDDDDYLFDPLLAKLGF